MRRTHKSKRHASIAGAITEVGRENIADICVIVAMISGVIFFLQMISSGPLDLTATFFSGAGVLVPACSGLLIRPAPPEPKKSTTAAPRQDHRTRRIATNNLVANNRR